MERRWNLVTEPWIPVQGCGLKSLDEIWGDPRLEALGGTAIHKLSITKFLLAIGQVACPMQNQEQWKSIGSAGLAAMCQDYCKSHRDDFWLYGDKPFLQMPILETCLDSKDNPVEVQMIGRVDVSDLKSENDTMLNQWQVPRDQDDASKALFLLSLMNHALGGKRTTNLKNPLTAGYELKKSARGAPSVGNYEGYLHTLILGETIQDTIWLNFFTKEELGKYPQWRNDTAIPPWEMMPSGEDDETAHQLKSSYLGTLCGVSRFCLLKENGIMYCEGIPYESHKNGWIEPTMTYSSDGKDIKVLWAKPERKPWRDLTVLLNPIFTGNHDGFSCPQIELLLTRAREAREVIGIWSGGIKFTTNAGDSSIKQTDDYVESSTLLRSSILGEHWFTSFQIEMAAMETIAKQLEYSIVRYFSGKIEGSKKKSKFADGISSAAIQDFWQLAEAEFKSIVDQCMDSEVAHAIRKRLVIRALDVFDTYCPNETSEQMISWAKSRPNYIKILRSKKEDTHGTENELE